MAKEITMPALSPSMTEGTLVKWLKKEGDEIKEGDVIAEVETDKATMDLEAFDSGVLLKRMIEEGNHVPVNACIAYIGKKGEKIDLSKIEKQEPARKPEVKEEKVSEPEAPVKKPSVQETPPVVSSGKRNVKASPLARKIAAEKGVSLASLSGSGPGGRIVKRDVEQGSVGGGVQSIFGTGPIGESERRSLSNMRKTIAKRLVESKTELPHFYLTIEIDVEELMKTRAVLNEELAKKGQGQKLSVNDFVMKGCVNALRMVPQVNASFEGDAIRYYGEVHLAFAAAIQDGLITPVIRSAHRKSIFEIAQEVKGLAQKARDGKLMPEEYSGGTFTVSNLGMYGIDHFSAIINPPQAAILAVGAVINKAVVNGRNEIVAGQRMGVTLSCDHRVVDGALGAEFLNQLRRMLENPALLFA